MRRDAFWSAVEASAAGGFSLVSAFLVARLVGPGALGTGAAATATNVVLWVAVNALFADAIVQRAYLAHHEAASAFWASCLAGFAAAILQAAAGWILADMLEDRRLVLMSLLLALPLPLVGGAGVIQGLLTRERAYRRLALRTIIGQGLGSLTGIAAALSGAGPWAIVLQQAVTTASGALALLIGAGRIPARHFDRHALRDLLTVGLPLTASTLILIGRYRLFAILIGTYAGSAVLGQVHIAFRLVDTVRDLSFTALWRLMLPAVSPHQTNRIAMLDAVDRWLRRGSLAILPLCAALTFGLTHVVNHIMGPAWDASERAALPLVALMALSVLTFPSGVALIAAGGARYALYGNLAALLLTCAGVVILPPGNAWDAVMIWTISQLLVQPYMLHINAKALGVGLFRPIAGVLTLRSRNPAPLNPGPLTPAPTYRN
jgi:O-antigen/teichoic acid export membrane protein